MIDCLSVFGPIHTFYEVAEGEFIVRFCYDLCTEFVHKHLVDQADSGSPLVKTIFEVNSRGGLVFLRMVVRQQRSFGPSSTPSLSARPVSRSGAMQPRSSLIG